MRGSLVVQTLGAAAVTLVLLAALASHAEPGVVAHPAVVTAGSVAARIESKGATATLLAVYDDPDVWAQIFDGVCSGEAGWVGVALKLSPEADAGAAEDIDQALGEALVQAPESTLVAMVSDPGGLDRAEIACGNYEVLRRRGEDDSIPALLTWLKKQQAAVAAVEDPRVRTLRDRCLRWIQAAQDEVQDPCFGKGQDCRTR
jgi:hypothetical protein